MPTYQEFTDSKVINTDRIDYMSGLLTIHAKKGFFYYSLKKPGMDMTVSSSLLEALEDQAFMDIKKLIGE